MISAIVVSHNAARHLRTCLQSLTANGEVDEIVVVDNASTDGSTELVPSEFPTCRLLALPENLGFGAANNRGVALAQGNRLLLVNSDAWAQRGTLPTLDLELDRDPELALVAPQLQYLGGGLQFTWVPETGIFGEALQKLRNPFEGAAWNHHLLPTVIRRLAGPGWYTAAYVLLRRRAFEQIGGFDEDFFLYFEDVDLCRRLRLAGWHLGQDRQVRAVHVKGGSGAAGQSVVHYRRAQRRYYAKHRRRWEQRFLAWRQRRQAERQVDPELRQQLLDVWRGDSPSRG